MEESPSTRALHIIIAEDHKWIRQALLRTVIQTLPDAATHAPLTTFLPPVEMRRELVTRQCASA